ncbi:hypothetical protein Tco_0848741 [Tanacetum coccineum]
MGDSSSQPRTDPDMSPINAFPVEELYSPQFLDSFQDNTGYWKEPNPHESLVEQVATSPMKKKKVTVTAKRGRFKVMMQPKIRGQQRKKLCCLKESRARVEDCVQMIHKSSGSSSFNTESGESSINLNTNIGDNNEDEVQEIRRPEGRDKARDAGKNKGSKAPGSLYVNEDALARLMVTEMTAQEKEQRKKFLEIKRREVKCRERKAATQEYRQEQEYMRFYLQPYDHLTRDRRKAMDEIRAKIKAKYNLQY